MQTKYHVEILKPNTMIVAEIGCNHAGDLQIAKKMIVEAAKCGAHCVKFQKRCVAELLSTEEYNAPHPNLNNSYGDSYGRHREALEFSAEIHKELMQFCRLNGIEYSTSVWDTTSAREIVALNPTFIKVGSPSNLHFKMQQILRDEYKGDVHISMGMTTHEEIDKIMDFWKGHEHRLVIYNCTSGYPVDFKDICLLDLVRLREKYSSRVKGFGFSGHHLGIAVDIAALALGAEWIERHFTLDRTMKGTDHAASLEPNGLQKLCRDCTNVQLALTKRPTGVLDSEHATRKKLKFNKQD
jgi:N-acetylneuraminate synthase